MVEVQVFRISSIGSAMFRAKRWFYGRFYTPAIKAGMKEIAEKNKEEWVKLAGKILEILQKLGSHYVIRLYIYFDTKISGYSRDNEGKIIKIEEFIPIGCRIMKYMLVGEEIIEVKPGAKDVIETLKETETA